MFGKLVATRPRGVAISHKDALDNCYNLALKWMSKSQEIIPELHCPYPDLVARLDRILSSDYVRAKPVVQTLDERPAEDVQRVQMEQFGGPPMGAAPGMMHDGHYSGPPVTGGPMQPDEQ
eukprot:838363-Pyramimonas_sp.AAC.1